MTHTSFKCNLKQSLIIIKYVFRQHCRYHIIASLDTMQNSVTLNSLNQDQKGQLGGREGGRCAIFALDSPLYFIQLFFQRSFAFLCEASYRGSIIVMNRLRKLSITSLVGHNESVTTPVLKAEYVNMNLSVQKKERSLCHWLAQCFPR